MGYEILLTAIFHIRLCHKFRDQSSVKGLSRQWVEFLKVRAGRIFTAKISICVDRRYLFFFPDRKSTKSWTNSYALERNSVQKMVGFIITECIDKDIYIARQLLYLGYSTFTLRHTRVHFSNSWCQSCKLTKLSIGNPITQIENPSKIPVLVVRSISDIGCISCRILGYMPLEHYLSNPLY